MRRDRALRGTCTPRTGAMQRCRSHRVDAAACEKHTSRSGDTGGRGMPPPAVAAARGGEGRHDARRMHLGHTRRARGPPHALSESIRQRREPTRRRGGRLAVQSPCAAHHAGAGKSARLAAPGRQQSASWHSCNRKHKGRRRGASGWRGFRITAPRLSQRRRSAACCVHARRLRQICFHGCRPRGPRATSGGLPLQECGVTTNC